MFDLTPRGDDLAAFVLDAARDSDVAEEQAIRQVAQNAAAELRRIIRSRFGTEWRVWDAAGFAKAIRVKRMGPGWYRVQSKAVYVRGRTQPVDLLWVFDTAPVVRSGKGKPRVAIPIKGQAPIHGNGRRYMSPSEAERAGWELEFAQVMGKDSQVVFGRRNRSEPFRPLWVMKPQVKEPKRFDLTSLHEKHARRLDEVWGELFDRRAARRAARRLAA